MPINVRATYFHRPARNVVIADDKSQTGKNAFGPSDGEEVMLGMSSERKVEKWTV
jgi:hypothetical protein